MGAFSHRIAIAATPQGPFEEIAALVDTGATYTWVPGSLLQRLGIHTTTHREFETADGRVLRREMGIIWIRLNGETLPNLVVFGDEGTTTLLGVVTLETFGLGVDPVRRRLIPVRSLLMACRRTVADHLRQQERRRRSAHARS